MKRNMQLESQVTVLLTVGSVMACQYIIICRSCISLCRFFLLILKGVQGTQKYPEGTLLVLYTKAERLFALVHENDFYYYHYPPPNGI